MLTEFRQIIFPSSDLAKAFKRQEFLDKASQDFRVVDIGDESIEFAFSHDLGETLEKLTLDTALVLRAMIRYCFADGIPIPRHALKTIEMVRGDLALLIHIDPQIHSDHENKYYVLL